ncbi:MAG TPA: vWA domain-containing protein [Polyangiaceae bacterium]|nr:vWA domain-containing protein [Polyangiaceae bacterium]
MKHRAQAAAAAVVLSVAGLVLWRSRGAPTPDAGPTPTPRVVEGPKPLEAPKPADNGQAAPRVDIVFALDTTSSMSGLIAGAKAKIWEIARKAQEGKPAPELRVGLVAYRDKGDQYVTKVLDLTGDLDKVYATLTELRAEGGGDLPEHVIKGLDDATGAVHWTSDERAVKLVYLVGDAPPKSYEDAPSLDEILARARRRGIRISAIRCGNNAQTLETWTTIAQRTDGEVSTIEQSGGVVAVATPFDAELARLNAELAATEVHWGSEGERRSAREDLHRNLAGSAAEQADRASFFGAIGSSAKARKKDLAASPTATAELAKVRDEDLPDELRSMSPEERGRFVEAKRARREAVLQEVRALSQKREDHLRAAAPSPAPTSFDGRVYDSLRKAGAKAGIAY